MGRLVKSAFVLGHETGGIWRQTAKCSSRPVTSLLFVAYPSMSINSGQRYTIRNEENGLAFDLFESYDNSVIGSGLHRAMNQQVTAFTILKAYLSYDHDTLQWITEQKDDGQWTLQSLSTHKRYLGFKNTPKDGTIIF